MFGKTALMLAGAAMLSTGVARAADVPAATTTALTAMYQLTCAAALDPSDKNFDAAFAPLSPDFVNIDTKGKTTTRDDVIGMTKQQLKTFHTTDCKNSFDSFTAPDATSVVVVNNGHFIGDMQAPDGKHDFDVTQKTQDTWKLVNGTWMETQSKQLRELVKIDGSVVQDLGQ